MHGEKKGAARCPHNEASLRARYGEMLIFDVWWLFTESSLLPKMSSTNVPM